MCRRTSSTSISPISCCATGPSKTAAGKRGRSGSASSPETDRNNRLGRAASGLANWATRRGNRLTRPALEAVAGVHRDARPAGFRAPDPRATRRRRNAGSRPGCAGVRPQGGDLRDLLRQRQQPGDRRRPAQGAGAQRRRDGGRLSRLLRHAPDRAGRPEGVSPPAPRGRPPRSGRGSTGATPSSRRSPPAP